MLLNLTKFRSFEEWANFLVLSRELQPVCPTLQSHNSIVNPYSRSQPCSRAPGRHGHFGGSVAAR